MRHQITQKAAIKTAKNMEATVVMAICQESKQAFAIRAEKRQAIWYFTWAFKLNPKSVTNEGYDKTIVSGQIQMETHYPGCPHCKAMGFCQCGVCSKLGCYNGQTVFKCPHCGNSGKVATAESFRQIDGNTF